MPPTLAASAKLLSDLATVILAAASAVVMEVIVTVTPEALAVTPTVPPLRAIAFAKFVAASVALAPTRKFNPTFELLLAVSTRA